METLGEFALVAKQSRHEEPGERKLTVSMYPDGSTFIMLETPGNEGRITYALDDKDSLQLQQAMSTRTLRKRAREQHKEWMAESFKRQAEAL